MKYPLISRRVTEESRDFREMFVLNPTPTWVYDKSSTRLLEVNDAALSQYGYDRDELIGNSANIFRAPATTVNDVVESFTGVASRTNQVFRHARKDGKTFFAEVREYDSTYRGCSVRVVSAEDVTPRLEAERALTQSQSALQRAQQIAHLGSYAYNYQTGDAHWSDELYRIVGAETDTVGIQDELCPFYHPEDAEEVRRVIFRAERDQKTYCVEYRILCEDGSIKSVQEHGHWVFSDDGEPIAKFGTLLDITARKNAESSLRNLAYHDALTGLRNRVGLRHEIRRIISNYKGDSLVAILFVDLDRFKIINDTLGHRVGDAVLAEVSSRLKSAVRNEDVAARTGGDEFIIVLDGVVDKLAISERAEHIMEVLAPAIHVGDNQHFVAASIGISLFPLDGAEADALLRNADVAMYAAKRRGGGAFEYYTPDLQYEASRRFRLERALRQALARHELGIRYQPILDVRTGAIQGVEALMRWNSLELGAVQPREFIEIADETGLISSMGRWAMTEAFSEALRWQKRGMPLQVWVNVSARQLRDRGFTKLVRELITALEIPPHLTGFEITEATFAGKETDVEVAIEALHDLRSLGVGLALGDLGVQHTSLSRLQRLPIDTVKIDSIFVSNLDVNRFARTIAESIVSLSRELGFKVVAEGVERREHLSIIRALGCDYWQGSLYSEARDVDEIVRLMRHPLLVP